MMDFTRLMLRSGKNTRRKAILFQNSAGSAALEFHEAGPTNANEPALAGRDLLALAWVGENAYTVTNAWGQFS